MGVSSLKIYYYLLLFSFIYLFINLFATDKHALKPESHMHKHAHGIAKNTIAGNIDFPRPPGFANATSIPEPVQRAFS